MMDYLLVTGFDVCGEVPDDGLPPGVGGAGDAAGGAVVPGVGGAGDCRTWPCTLICNVGTRDIPVSNIIDNPITNNFDILCVLRLC